MQQKFIDYLESIGIKSGLLLDRIESIHAFYIGMCPGEIEDIFVTEYIDSDGKREYENMWFFSDRYIMDAKGFAAGSDEFVITQIRGKVAHFRIKKQDYDFKAATERSRLHLMVHFNTAAVANLTASKENCDALRDIILKYVKTNMER
ncbi:MAG: hypothetical protein U9R15_01495 [Chloroflexota bacterium]|nr:hypothetical protein [Chloroflexota bacterium]